MLGFLVALVVIVTRSLHANYCVNSLARLLFSLTAHFFAISSGQALYARYIKEMVCAVDADGDGKISRQELAALLHTIGASSTNAADDDKQQQDPQMTDEDLQAIIDEFGERGNCDDSEHAHRKSMHIECVEDLILNAGFKANF